jgi:hypothetical protein
MSSRQMIYKVKHRNNKGYSVAVLTVGNSTVEFPDNQQKLNFKYEELMTPGQAIKKNCIDCVGSVGEVRKCQGDKLLDSPCLLYSYRMGKGRPSVRLIRKYCIYCMGGSVHEVKNCSNTNCSLFPYRMGRNPNVSPGRAKNFSGNGAHGRFKEKLAVNE